MSVLVAREIQKSYGDRLILKDVTLYVGEHDRIGLVGVNGSGKSTLLRVLSGEEDADSGQVQRPEGLGFLSQQPVFDGATVGEVADQAVAWHRALLHSYEDAIARGDLHEASVAQDRLDQVGWEVAHRVDAMLEQLRAPAREALIENLSGGELRRVALARVLLEAPAVLLLDEPTNHLDADTADWLQAWLQGYQGAVILVTHDRYLLEAVAERIVEVEGGVSVAYEGSYGDYLVARSERHERLRREDERADEILRREAAWAVRSPSARTGKQKARLSRLDKLREREGGYQDQNLTLSFTTGFRKGGTMLEAHRLSKSYGKNRLFDGLEISLLPGERLGILGPNGAGKSTLLRVLLGEETPDRGEVSRAPRVKVGMIDQARSGLDPEHTVFEAAGAGNEQVKVGENWIHVASFLGKFLFFRDHFEQRVASLSGGERARLLLARLMLEGANLLVLDEPTNDLDLLTLRVLEEALLSFDGSVIVVTHDRAFMDRVCSSVLAFEGEGRAVMYADRMQHVAAMSARRAEARAERVAEKAPPPKPAKAKLSWKEQRELEQLPERIEAAEDQVVAAEAVLADPATYQQRAADVPSLNKALAALQQAVEALYARWEELSERA
ncbi:MAG: ABC-F family ATP-binding cassette domain-containing protein [Deltaproteobacteria bacterium]|nr:ABC-F family ATP-binding cassette domain-containing protein [Deltaproteobacteria bacterium]